MVQNSPPKNFIQVPSKVDGIEVFAPAPEVKDEEQAVVEFKCPQCGADTAYSVSDGGLKCSHCGYYSPPQKNVLGRQAHEFEFTLETVAESERGRDEERQELECQTCGARTSISSQELTHTCAFCGSNNVIQRQPTEDVLRPRFLIPFQLEAEKCQQIAANWLGSSWMVPTGLQKLADQSRFHGVYIPYWTFDAVTNATWKAEVGHTEHERYFENGEWKVRTITVWRWEEGRVREKYDDMLQPATGRLSSVLLSQAQRYDISALRSYEASFLAGIQALGYDVPLEKAWDTARGEMRERTRKACRGQASTSQVRNFSMSLDFGEESWRYILLPVYLSSYQHGGQNYHVLVNGQNGEIAGQRPVDWGRVWLVIGLVMTPGLLMALVGLLTFLIGGIGVILGGVGLFLLIIGAIISAIILRKASMLDDI
jgi:predicted RNA-binding Zn-ribbon protein involved in translation (DUF1610 family)